MKLPSKQLPLYHITGLNRLLRVGYVEDGQLGY